MIAVGCVVVSTRVLEKSRITRSRISIAETIVSERSGTNGRVMVALDIFSEGSETESGVVLPDR